MSLPRITVVTPSFNQAQFIERTITSILDQGYPNLEYFVVDGGSTDGTVEILRKYEKHLAGWVSEKDRGQTHAINKGFARATGEVHAYLNSDDWYLPGALSAVGAHFAAHPETGLLHGRCVRTEEDETRRDVQLGSIETASQILDLWGVWWKNRQFVQPEVFWSTGLARKAGSFNESLYFAMDYEYWLRLLLAGAKVARIDREVACFRFHAAQKSGLAEKAADELRAVVRPYLWDASVPLGFRERLRLQATWLYDGPFRVLADRSVASGEAKVGRWIRLAGFAMIHPKVLMASGLRSRLLRGG